MAIEEDDGSLASGAIRFGSIAVGDGHVVPRAVVAIPTVGPIHADPGVFGVGEGHGPGRIFDLVNVEGEVGVRAIRLGPVLAEAKVDADGGLAINFAWGLIGAGAGDSRFCVFGPVFVPHAVGEGNAEVAQEEFVLKPHAAGPIAIDLGGNGEAVVVVGEEEVGLLKGAEVGDGGLGLGATDDELGGRDADGNENRDDGDDDQEFDEAEGGGRGGAHGLRKVKVTR